MTPSRYHIYRLTLLRPYLFVLHLFKFLHKKIDCQDDFPQTWITIPNSHSRSRRYDRKCSVDLSLYFPLIYTCGIEHMVVHVTHVNNLNIDYSCGKKWAAHVLHMRILSGKLSCPLPPYWKHLGSSVSSPLLPIMKKCANQWTVEWVAHGLHVGIFTCKCCCLLLSFIVIVGSSGDNSVGQLSR